MPKYVNLNMRNGRYNNNVPKLNLHILFRLEINGQEIGKCFYISGEEESGSRYTWKNCEKSGPGVQGWHVWYPCYFLNIVYLRVIVLCIYKIGSLTRVKLIWVSAYQCCLLIIFQRTWTCSFSLRTVFLVWDPSLAPKTLTLIWLTPERRRSLLCQVSTQRRIE